MTAVSLCAPGQNGAPLAAAAGPIELGSNPVSVTLKPPGGKNDALPDRLRTLAPNARIYLRLDDLVAAEAPGVLYGVYLDLPHGADPKANGEYLVGYLNFFNVQGTRRHSTRTFDVTNLIEKLQEQRALSIQTTVTICPQEAAAEGSKPTIGRIELLQS